VNVKSLTEIHHFVWINENCDRHGHFLFQIWQKVRH